MNGSDNKKWTVLKSEYLHREPWLTVRREFVELPNGKTIPEYYILEYPDWVNVIAITKDHQFVLIRQYRHGIGETYYELPAGTSEKEDPNPLVSAKRELLEETGYGEGVWQEYMVISSNSSTNTNLTYCYLATDVEKVTEPHLDETEDLSVHLLSLDELKDILAEDGIKQALHAAPLWKYIAKNRLF